MEDKLKLVSEKTEISKEVLQKVIDLTDKVKENSYSCYSKFRVGSVVVSTDGNLTKGVNVENLSYGLTNCAERSAIYSAVSNGDKQFSLISVSSDLETFLTPCGACRQVISEFSIPWVLLINKSKDIDIMSLDSLLPNIPQIDHLKKA
jgi:cytidine deaminase